MSILILSAEDMMSYIENPNDTTRKLQKLINELSELLDTKLIYRNLLNFYILTMGYQKGKLRK